MDKNPDMLSIAGLARKDEAYTLISATYVRGIAIRTSEPSRFLEEAKSEGVDTSNVEFDMLEGETTIRFPDLTSDRRPDIDIRQYGRRL